MMLSLPTLTEPQHFSLAERIIFSVLAAAGLALFWRRFGPIVAVILKSKKDADAYGALPLLTARGRNTRACEWGYTPVHSPGGNALCG